MKRTLILVLVAALVILFTTGAYGRCKCRWILYDDFEDYTSIEDMIASGKWFISEESGEAAKFSIEEGRLKIVQDQPDSFGSAYAEIIKHPNPNIWKGIKATVTVETLIEDAGAQIAADVGTLKNDPDSLVWYQMTVKNLWNSTVGEYVPAVTCFAGVLDDGWKYDIFYAHLGSNKQAIAGLPYIVIATFNPESISYHVKKPNNIGGVIYQFTEKIVKLEEPFLGIGTRKRAGTSSCVVYFDDVYVLRYTY